MHFVTEVVGRSSGAGGTCTRMCPGSFLGLPTSHGHGGRCGVLASHVVPAYREAPGSTSASAFRPSFSGWSRPCGSLVPLPSFLRSVGTESVKVLLLGADGICEGGFVLGTYTHPRPGRRVVLRSGGGPLWGSSLVRRYGLEPTFRYDYRQRKGVRDVRSFPPRYRDPG